MPLLSDTRTFRPRLVVSQEAELDVRTSVVIFPQPRSRPQVVPVWSPASVNGSMPASPPAMVTFYLAGAATLGFADRRHPAFSIIVAGYLAFAAPGAP